jgi:hypothetical protein
MMDHNAVLIAAAEAYMLAVKRLGEESGYNRLTYFEAPILKMPTEDMREEAHERWLELNISGQQLSDAVNAVKLTINEPQAAQVSDKDLLNWIENEASRGLTEGDAREALTAIKWKIKDGR